MDLNEIRDLMRKLEVKREGRPFKPHILTEEWVRWIERYQTPEEKDEIQKILQVIGGLHYDSDEHQVLSHRLHELCDAAEDRAYAAPVQFWPRALRVQEDKMRAWKNYERKHPREWVDPRIPPPPGCVYVTYYKGFIPQELTIPTGATVTWVNRDPVPIHGHFVRHVNTTGEPLFDSTLEVTGREIEGGKSWAFTFTEPGIYEYKCNHDKHACGEGGKIIVADSEQNLEDIANEQEQMKKVISNDTSKEKIHELLSEVLKA